MKGKTKVISTYTFSREVMINVHVNGSQSAMVWRGKGHISYKTPFLIRLKLALKCLFGQGITMDITLKKLIRLQEECGELIQACSKIMRFGLLSDHNGMCTPNWRTLIKEAADVQYSIRALDLPQFELDQAMFRKEDSVRIYTQNELQYDKDYMNKDAP